MRSTIGRSVPGMRFRVACLLVLAACASTAEAPTSSPAVTSSTDVPAPSALSAADPTSSTDDSRGVVPVGFETTAARVVMSDGTVCDLCVWLADTSDRRSRGLMFVSDLAPADAMAFLYPEPHRGTFWMKDTVLPLSIAFVAPDGTYIDAFDMEPCLVEACPSYRTPDDFLIAIEVPQGGLDELGLTPGSSFELLDLPCAE